MDIKFIGNITNCIIIHNIKVIPKIPPKIIPIFFFINNKILAAILVIPFTINKEIPEKIKF